MQQKPGYSRKASQNGACTAQYMVSSLPYHIFFEVWRKSCGVFAAKQLLCKVPPHTSPSVGCAPCRMRCSIWWLAVVMIMCCIGRRHSSWRGINYWFNIHMPVVVYWVSRGKKKKKKKRLGSSLSTVVWLKKTKKKFFQIELFIKKTQKKRKEKKPTAVFLLVLFLR